MKATNPPLNPIAGAVVPPAPGAGAGTPTGLPHDIRGLLVIPLPWWEVLLLVVVALVLLLAAVWAWRWWARRRAAKPSAPADPWQVLLARLGAVQPAVPFTKTAQEEFFFELSLILRQAIELRTQIPATDRTCQELRIPLRNKLPVSPEATEAVLAFLERADYIKFAKAPSDTAEALAAAARVGEWLRALAPVRGDGAATRGQEEHRALG